MPTCFASWAGLNKGDTISVGQCDFALHENSKDLWTLAANTLTARAAELANTFPRLLNK